MGTDRTTRQSVKVWYTTDITNLIRNAKGQIVFWTRANKSGRPAVLYGWGYEK
jgi:hypothetical protein